MIINHNIASMGAWRNLQSTEMNMNKALERLSSGLRINRAADDAAGLAISEKMRAQISGLDQASANAQSGISLLQTAEGALNESTSILQRMRQLAVQASADSANAADRQQMQKEMDQLANELSRISNTTEFNTKNLLGGAFKSQIFQIGANANQTVSVDVNAMDAATLGVTASKGVTIADGNLVSSATLSAGATATTQAYQVTGTVTAATADSYTESQASAAATGITTFNAGADEFTATAASNGSGSNGWTITSVTGGAGAGNPTASADTTGKVITLNLSTNAANNTATNVLAALNTTSATSGLTFTQTAGAGADTIAGAANSTATAGGLDAVSIKFSAVNAGSGSGLQVKLLSGGASGTASAALAGSQLTVTYYGNSTIDDILTAVNTNASVNSMVTASSNSTTSAPWAEDTAGAFENLTGGTNASLTVNLLDANSATVQSGVTVSGGSASFSNGLTVSINSTVANSLASGSIATQTIDVVAGNSNAAVAGTNGVINSQATVTKGVLIDTATNAQSAITAVDAAISKVSTARATLGALQNRLEHTIANLGVTSGNMQAAESRIRDVDMAKEMASFTRDQILMQAGTAMLAQANQKPQSVLQLLR